MNLLADRPGEYSGISANFSGDGFADMRFIAKAAPAADYAGWVAQVRAAGPALDIPAYAALAKPSLAVPPTTYRSVDPVFPAHCRPRRRSIRKNTPARPGGRSRPKQEAEVLGSLSWAAIPLQQPLPLYAMGVVGVVILAALGLITGKGWWPYLWREWLTSVDHKRIGVMYVILALVMLLRGFSDAIMMRSQQAIAIDGARATCRPITIIRSFPRTAPS